MKIVVSVRTEEEIEKAQRYNPDLIEVRLDLIDADVLSPDTIMSSVDIPVIVTCRSLEEGGTFLGTPGEWFDRVKPWLECAVYVDVERRQREYSEVLRERRLNVIASCHCSRMLSTNEFTRLERELRSLGNVPKIVVTPSSVRDVLILMDLTACALRPICTGIQGNAFRFGRLLLPLVGSEFAYCHAGNPAAEGQYHIADFRSLFAQLQG